MTSMALQERVLGRTGLRIRCLGMGGAFVTSRAGTERAEAQRAIRRALDLGVNYLDTAPSYSDSEEVLGEALRGVPPESYVLATKLGGRPQPFDPRDKRALHASVEESLRLLGREWIDVLLVHEPDRPGQYDWWTDWERFDGPVNEVLEELKAAGRIRFTGLGGTTAYELARIVATGRFDVVLTAFNYSLLWREAAVAVIPEASRRNMGIICGSPLQQGALSQRYDADIEANPAWLSPPRREQYRLLYALCDESGIPLTEMGVRFVLSNPDVSLTLMGSRSVAEVEANVRAAERGPLPADLLARLQAIYDLVPFRPCEEPFFMPFTRPYTGPARAGH
jgi:aryl-alcohol dehydrogenase-like predicted oxidoreductase